MCAHTPMVYWNKNLHDLPSALGRVSIVCLCVERARWNTIGHCLRLLFCGRTL
jgi:tRNA pseudouridine-54 N-methylase